MATIAPIRTYHPRQGRLSGRHRAALADLAPRLSVAIDGEPLDLAAVFGRVAPVVLEIGSGMGEATAAMAAADPARDYLAVEVHKPGVANLLALVDHAGLANVRVAEGDALDLVRARLSPDSLSAIHVFFPDPWPKPRHHKRRLVSATTIALLRSRLVAGGSLRCATDHVEYAAVMRAVLAGDPELSIVDSPDVSLRPVTKFELRALEAGRSVTDLVAIRTGRS
jgi:tRNA (guanine-N7-)-methyltransferase